MPGRGGKGKSSKKGGSKKGESSGRTRELMLKTEDQGELLGRCFNHNPPRLASGMGGDMGQRRAPLEQSSQGFLICVFFLV
jgi:hypothetical protein